MSLPAVQARGKAFLSLNGLRSRPYWPLLSRATILATGTFAKLVMTLPLKYKTTGFEENFLRTFDQCKQQNKGFLTIMNHSSLLDDPFAWGVLPWWKFYVRGGNIRWGLGADNVCFGTPFLRFFFSLGQVLSTTRFGGGPFQGSIDAAIHLLSKDHQEYPKQRSNWVHIFPEAFVHQVYPPHENSLRYFHWGVSRLILEADECPAVLPIFSHGFDKVIPEDRPDDYRLWKQIGTTIHFGYGKALDEKLLAEFREKWRALVEKEQQGHTEPLTDLTDNLKFGPEAQKLRSDLARYLRDQLGAVRETMGFPPQNPEFAEPEFWKPEGGCKDVPVMGIVNKLPHHK